MSSVPRSYNNGATTVPESETSLAGSGRLSSCRLKNVEKERRMKFTGSFNSGTRRSAQLTLNKLNGSFRPLEKK